MLFETNLLSSKKSKIWIEIFYLRFTTFYLSAAGYRTAAVRSDVVLQDGWGGAFPGLWPEQHEQRATPSSLNSFLPPDLLGGESI